MFRSLSFAVAAVFMATTFASAQVSMKLKYPEGTKYSTQTESKTTQTLNLLGMDIDTESTTFIRSTKSIGKRDAGGVLKVEEKIDSLQSEISLPGGIKMTFDSANPGKEAPLPQLEPLMEMFRTISKNSITVEVDSKDKITDVKLPEGEAERLPADVKDRFSPDALKKSSEQAIDFLPDQPVKKGDTWERSSEINLGAGQVLGFRNQYQYAGTVEKDGATLDKVTCKVLDVSYTVNGNPMLQVTKSDLKVTESDNTYLFNREQGAVISKTQKVKISGTLTLVINNMELPGKVDLTLEEKVTRDK